MVCAAIVSSLSIGVTAVGLIVVLIVASARVIVVELVSVIVITSASSVTTAASTAAMSVSATMLIPVVEPSWSCSNCFSVLFPRGVDVVSWRLEILEGETDLLDLLNSICV